MRLQTKLMLLICTLVTIVIMGLSFTLQRMWTSSLKDQKGLEALHLAKTVASIPEIRRAFSYPNPTAAILPIVEEIRQHAGAEFITVGNRAGIRYAHPVPSRIGQPMIGGDNEPVFEGKSIVSEAVGSLGLSLRGKTPIFDDQDNVIGVVSVGFLLTDIKEEIMLYQKYILVWATLALLLGGLGAVLIARNVKRAIHGLEPAQIGMLYKEKEAVLESIREGIIAVNRQGVITTVNHTAVHMLGLNRTEDVVGKPISAVNPHTKLMEVIESGKAQYDKEAIIRDQVIVANRLPIMNHQQQVVGAVSSFRSKSEMYLLTQQLSQLRTYADGLRAQTHEYSNKLYLIAGLIQLESYQEAIDIITSESNLHHNLLQFIMHEIPDPVIGGLLIGKFNRANELNVSLHIHPDSSFRDVPVTLERNQMVTIVGNLIDNAMEAVQAAGDTKDVQIFLTDLGTDLIIEIEDTGTGIAEQYSNDIFSIGFSTKAGQHRGFGLALVKQAVNDLHGMITYQPREGGQGTVFTVIIPKVNPLSDHHATAEGCL
ncbi:ATP-binding protein [Paenibacillus sp. 481]|uniref:ATP-binding protein n=1 Tax=Paenibacillus sp. 481 TaxID=2835869 RepID=UPI001E3FDB7F|nr:sensor histidine kinase [Paenibacillus sp. 481]UHA72398.1 sensor histidine kinase [Paenibacillus sp. 481]